MQVFTINRFSSTLLAVLLFSVILTPKVEAGSGYYEEGMKFFVNEDYVLARESWSPIAKSGHVRAQKRMGDLYYHGYGVAKDLKIAGDWWERAAESGDVEAQHNMGVLARYQESLAGVTKPQDREESRRWFDQSLASGFVLTEHLLGETHFNASSQGDREQNLRIAEVYLRRASKQEHPDSQYLLAMTLIGLDDEDDEIRSLIQKAADGGFEPAKVELMYSLRYEKWGFKKDTEQSLELARSLALSGVAAAQSELCFRYAFGDELSSEPDFSIAKTWCEKAAERADPAAYVYLSYIDYAIGDQRQALESAHQAAKYGNSAGMTQYFLIQRELAGDLVYAKKYLVLAALNGNENAKTLTESLGIDISGKVQIAAAREAFRISEIEDEINENLQARRVLLAELDRPKLESETWRVLRERAKIEIDDIETKRKNEEERAKFQLVSNIQSLLIKYKYLDGNADGISGAKTEAAITLFFEDLGLSRAGLSFNEIQQILLQEIMKSNQGCQKRNQENSFSFCGSVEI
jgi:TPR repeat protein